MDVLQHISIFNTGRTNFHIQSQGDLPDVFELVWVHVHYSQAIQWEHIMCYEKVGEGSTAESPACSVESNIVWFIAPHEHWNQNYGNLRKSVDVISSPYVEGFARYSLADSQYRFTRSH